MTTGMPTAQGLYDPRNEHDGCGVGFLVDLKGRKSHKIVRDGMTALINLDHRGACGCEVNTGDGAGILIQIPHDFLKARCDGDRHRLPEPGRYGVGAFFCSPKPESCRVGQRDLRADRRRGRPDVPRLAEARRPTTATSARRPGRSSRASSTPSSARPAATTPTASSASSTSSASGSRPRSRTRASTTTSSSTSPACRAARWSTRACSRPSNSRPTTPTTSATSG